MRSLIVLLVLVLAICANAASISGTIVRAGSGDVIYDNQGNAWAINSAGQITVNGTIDRTSANVVELVWYNNLIWQENGDSLWWSKSSPSDSWTPPEGTPVNPLPSPAPTPSPSGTVVVAGSGQLILDREGTRWGISSNGQVTFNGQVDGSTANVIEIAYVNGALWQENADKMWWSKTSSTDTEWLPPYGTSVSPVTPPTPKPTSPPTPKPTSPPTPRPTSPPTPKPTSPPTPRPTSPPTPKPTSPPTPKPTSAPVSPSGTVVMAGSGQSIRDQNGDVWTIDTSERVAINGVADRSTSRVLEIAYVNGLLWQENADKLWWSKTSASATQWLPTYGTNVSPVSNPTPKPTQPPTPKPTQPPTPKPTQPPTPKPTPSPPTQAPTTPPGATRNYWDHPGGDASVWNTPLGDGAIWGGDYDADTIDLRHGGFINTVDNYGEVIWVSQSASNPVASFVANEANYEVAGPDHGNGTVQLVTAHLVPGSRSAGPYPARTDQPYSFIDTVGNPGMLYQYGPVVIQNFQAGQGPFYTYFGSAENCLIDHFGEDQETGNAGDMMAVGTIRAYDLDPARNPSRMAPGITAIQHMLRFTMNSDKFKANARTPAQGNNDYPNGLLAPNSWPNNYQDYQGGDVSGNDYTGNLIFGTTVGIPKDVPMPSGMSTAGQQLFWTLQHYGAIPRDVGGDFVLFVDQDVPQSWTDAGSWDLQNSIVPLLRPLRNQHQGGQDFTQYPRNGPGTRLDSGPPRLNIPVVHPSPSGTVVSGTGASITDSLGNVYKLTGSGQVEFNGFVQSGNNAVKLAYVSGTVWYQQSSGTWYSKPFPYSRWTQGQSPV